MHTKRLLVLLAILVVAIMGFSFEGKHPGVIMSFFHQPSKQDIETAKHSTNGTVERAVQR